MAVLWLGAVCGSRCLQMMEEFFLFLMYLALGLKEKDIWHCFNFCQSTVSCIINTWIHFLYTWLGSIGIWMSPEAVRASMPSVLASTQTPKPPFLSKKSQIPSDEVRVTQEIARLRIHVERINRRIKEHKLFDTLIPLSVAGSINQLFTVASLLANYQNKPL
ncbi:unnamed protein product, partial [Coregonus sp. 'balchen']